MNWLNTWRTITEIKKELLTGGNCQAVGWFDSWLVGWKPTRKLTNYQTFPESLSNYHRRRMLQMTIEHPALLPDALQQTRADFEQEAKMATAVKLF
jgi:hypothetical protein